MQTQGNLTSLDELGVGVVVRVLKYLTSTQCARLSTLSRTLRKATENEELWKLYLYSEFGSELVDEDEPRYRDLANGYQKYYKDFYLARRDARRCWEKIKSCAVLAKKELSEGVDEETITVVEDFLQIHIPLVVKEVYRIHNGQKLEALDELFEHNSMDLSELDKLRFDRILPLEDAVLETVELRDCFMNESWNVEHHHVPCRIHITSGIYDVESIDEIIFSSIVVATEHRVREMKRLLIKVDTNEIFVWNVPFSLTQVSTKTDYCNPMLFLTFFASYRH